MFTENYDASTEVKSIRTLYPDMTESCRAILSGKEQAFSVKPGLAAQYGAYFGSFGMFETALQLVYREDPPASTTEEDHKTMRLS